MTEAPKPIRSRFGAESLRNLRTAIILPVLLCLVVRMIPAPLMAEFRKEAQNRAARPVSRAGALAIVAIWIAAFGLAISAFWPTAAP